MPAPASKVVLRVDPATATAYRKASKEERERARLAFERALDEQRERDRKEAAGNVLQIMDEMAREAKERGLTPELLEQILNEDPDQGA